MNDVFCGIDKNTKFLIVGLGLMGGSYAKALKKHGFCVYAIDNNEKSINYALENGIIDKGAITPDEQLVNSADIVVFALYPQVFKQWIKDNQYMFKSGALITDVTGVKSGVVEDIQSILRNDVEFIAAHPMAGKEVYGVQNSDDKIFLNANYIVVPTEKNTPAAIDKCKALGIILRFERISELTPDKHDEMIGFVSQLTHLIAISLMTCSDNEHLVDYTGDSFRDLTRIARINENMWCELFLMNKDRLLAQMNAFENEFCEIKNMLQSENIDGLKEKMRLSTKRRALFDKK